MRPFAFVFRGLSAALAVLSVAAAAAAQDAPPEPRPGPAPPNPPNLGPPNPPADRQAMWPAPTAEDWKKPVLVKFQRTWDDALAVSAETGRPILVCVNMDGEIASEHYAGIRYREPEIAKLYEPHVCVIASTYRHNDRDYDDEGHRILCPRFGSVTCGEHIWIEPVLYEKFFDGKRVAPRHILVGMDGKEAYDVYFINDTASVFQTIKDGAADLPKTPPVVRGDRPMSERVASRHVDDRNAVESAYQAGDAAAKKALLEAALKNPGAAPLDLLRLSLFGFDTDMSKLARDALTKTDTPDATSLLADALRVPMEDAEREALIGALARLGEKSERAKWLAAVHGGLNATSGSVNVKKWTRAGGEYAPPPPGSTRVVLDAMRSTKWQTARSAPQDGNARLEFAEASLELAMEAKRTAPNEGRAERMSVKLLFEDARAAALYAEEHGVTGWRVNAVISLADYYTEKLDEAYARAEAAAKDVPPTDGSWNSKAVLTIFAEGRWKAIHKAVKEKAKWPPEWLADVHAANTVLLRHPLGTEEQAVWHVNFLGEIGAYAQQARFLDEAITRFPSSFELHRRLRRRIFGEKGVDGLEPAYEAMLRDRPGVPALESFAGYASAVTGDFRRQRGALDEAVAAYDRAIAHYEKVIAAAPERRDLADHAVAMLFASRARIALDRGDLDRAFAEIVASFERRPNSAGSKDGVGIIPGETAQALRAKLVEAKKDDLVTKLDAALAKLDPELLRPDRPDRQE